MSAEHAASRHRHNAVLALAGAPSPRAQLRKRRSASGPPCAYRTRYPQVSYFMAELQRLKPEVGGKGCGGSGRRRDGPLPPDGSSTHQHRRAAIAAQRIPFLSAGRDRRGQRRPLPRRGARAQGALRPFTSPRRSAAPTAAWRWASTTNCEGVARMTNALALMEMVGLGLSDGVVSDDRRRIDRLTRSGAAARVAALGTVSGW